MPLRDFLWTWLAGMAALSVLMPAALVPVWLVSAAGYRRAVALGDADPGDPPVPLEALLWGIVDRTWLSLPGWLLGFVLGLPTLHHLRLAFQ
jgi:hypothetical protein